MGWWYVRGGDEGQSFRIGENGYTASGVGKQSYSHFNWELKELALFQHLPAHWTVFRARDSVASAQLLGQNLQDGKEYLDPAAVRIAEKPAWVISKHDESVGFALFLPDLQYYGVMDWLEQIGRGAPMRYQFSLGFEGLMPRSVQDYPELVSCDEWLQGRPYVGQGDDFSFVVRKKEA